MKTPSWYNTSDSSRTTSLNIYQVARTTRKLSVLSMDILDSPDVNGDKMRKVIAEERTASFDHTTRNLISTERSTLQPDNVGQGGGTLSVGIIIPLTVVSFAMLVICLVLGWHNCYDRKRARRYRVDNLSGFQRSLNEWNWEDWRGSSRSTAPLQKNNQADFKPTLGQINENSEDKITDDTLSSAYSNAGFNIPTVSGNVPYFRSPSFVPEVSQSYPNLMITPQPPFSPYHITWITPLSPRIVHSDPNIVQNVFRNKPNMIPSGKNEVNSRHKYRHTTNSVNSWKSPYHPNFNTPTNGSETDSNYFPSNVLINRMRSTATPESTSRPSSKESSLRERQNVCGLDDAVTYVSDTNLQRPTNPSFEPKGFKSTPSLAPKPFFLGAGMNDPSNCLNSALPWQHNQCFSCPPPNSFPMFAPFCNPTGGIDDQCNYGALAELNWFGSEFIPSDMASIDTSVYPLMGSSSTSECLMHSGSGGPLPNFHGIASTNTSLSAQIDSCETSQSYSSSTMAGLGSQNISGGYNPGPSHSTSIAGRTSGNTSQNPSRNHSSSNLNIQGISAIPLIAASEPATPKKQSEPETMKEVSDDVYRNIDFKSQQMAALLQSFQEHSLEWDSFGCTVVFSDKENPEVEQKPKTIPTPSVAKKQSVSGVTSVTEKSIHAGEPPTTPCLKASMLWDAYPFYSPGGSSREENVTDTSKLAAKTGKVKEKKRLSDQPLLSDRHFWV